MTEQLADLLDQYLAATNQPPAYVDSEGIFTIETSDGLLIGATMLADGRLELFTNPGHVSAATLQGILEDDEEEDDDDFDEANPKAVPGALVRWQAHEAEWGIHVDRSSGLVTLTELTAQLPWHPDGLAALLDTFREEHASWAARLESKPAGEQATDPTAPAVGLDILALTRA